MAELIWVQDEEAGSPTQYADHGRFRALIVRHDESEERVTIRYFLRNLESNVDEKVSYLQVHASRAASVIEGLKTNLENELNARAGDVPDDIP